MISHQSLIIDISYLKNRTMKPTEILLSLRENVKSYGFDNLFS